MLLLFIKVASRGNKGRDEREWVPRARMNLAPTIGESGKWE